MKFIFAFILLCMSYTVFAQQQPEVYKKSFLDSMMKKANLISTQNSPQAKYSHTLSNGDAVYLLPQDNMPCIVPHTYSNMPVMRGRGNGQMPNIAPPQQIIPRQDSSRIYNKNPDIRRD